MTKIFIATPAFDGKVNVQYACSLCDTRLCMAANNIHTLVRINTSGSLLVRERNDLIKAFIETDATHMLCIDSDIGWNPTDVKKLIDYDEDFVAALYPARGPDKCFIFRGVYEDENKKMTISEKGLLQMEYIPAGFMLLKRCVLEKMIADFPELYYIPKDESLKHTAGHYLFATEIWDGEFWGEDYVFCRRARQSGFKIWIDPTIELDHAGTRGAFIEALTNEPQIKE
ncbi:MAG: hypothetical protein C5B43_01235 [Verrucomicrobia bacterium]|nr:MAG: hypothetical protein C5B43_01235 [Verrucomicrobiota bacterium]